MKKLIEKAIWAHLATLRNLKETYKLCGGDVSTFDEPCEKGYVRNGAGECVPDEGESEPDPNG